MGYFHGVVFLYHIRGDNANLNASKFTEAKQYKSPKNWVVCNSAPDRVRLLCASDQTDEEILRARAKQYSPRSAQRSFRIPSNFLFNKKSPKGDFLLNTERSGFEPEDPISQVNCLAGSSVRPLRHLSKMICIE